MWTDAGENDGVFSNEEFDRVKAVVEVLTEYYPFAKEAILSLEVYSKKRSQRAVYELRDTLDHLSIAVAESTSPAEARRHIAECHTHLRRAAIEPFEWLAEHKFLEIERIAVKGRWIYRLVMIRPPEGYEVITELGKIAAQIVKGRVAKGTAESVGLMRQATEMATECLEKLKPKEFHDRLYHLALCVGGLIIGIPITIAGEHLWAHFFGH